MKRHGESDCEECGRHVPPGGGRVCRRCEGARETIERLEEAAWKGRAWSAFTRLETANPEA